MVLVMSENGHATNQLAVDLARENDRLSGEVARLTSRVHEVEAQIAALTPPSVTLGDQVIDLMSGHIRRDGKVIGHLTRNELAIVSAMAAAPGVAVPYSRIRDVAWPEWRDLGESFRHMVRVNLSRIRTKLDGGAVQMTGRSSTKTRYFFVVADVGAGLVQ